ncbi:MAG: hypothetical protein GC190_02210 [Alphaproteobacteria bacterium]|nr:hypothetical protein [Alphaproteobacteria bacterium]
MQRMAVVTTSVLALAIATAHAATIKFRCTVKSTPKSESEEYIVDTDAGTVTVVLHGIRGNVLNSRTHDAKISPDAIEWTVETAGDLSWTLRYDRAAKTLTSSNSHGESFKETCKVAS